MNLLGKIDEEIHYLSSEIFLDNLIFNRPT